MKRLKIGTSEHHENAFNSIQRDNLAVTRPGGEILAQISIFAWCDSKPSGHPRQNLEKKNYNKKWQVFEVWLTENGL